jgi:hypothetical protein
VNARENSVFEGAATTLEGAPETGRPAEAGRSVGTAQPFDDGPLDIVAILDRVYRTPRPPGESDALSAYLLEPEVEPAAAPAAGELESLEGPAALEPTPTPPLEPVQPIAPDLAPTPLAATPAAPVDAPVLRRRRRRPAARPFRPKTLMRLLTPLLWAAAIGALVWAWTLMSR